MNGEREVCRRVSGNNGTGTGMAEEFVKKPLEIRGSLHGRGLVWDTKTCTDETILPVGKLTCSVPVILSNGFDAVLSFCAVCRCSKTEQHIG